MSLLLLGSSTGQSSYDPSFLLEEKNVCNACLLLSDNFMLGMSGSHGCTV